MATKELEPHVSVQQETGGCGMYNGGWRDAAEHDVL